MKPISLKIKVPEGFVVTKNVLTTYDPQSNFTEENNLAYLQEDLFQTTNKSKGITIDVGWYGDLVNNHGIFKIYVIKGFDWENPIKVLETKSIKEMHKLLIQEIKQR